MTLLKEIRQRFRAALSNVCDSPDEYVRSVGPAQDERFGDFQANFAMVLAKRLGKSPRDIAQQVASHLQLDDLCQAAEIAGPGFINLRLTDDGILSALQTAFGDDRLSLSPVVPPATYVVDFSSPNVAKPMHVGHIRSTVIGDALARILRFVGHRVITDNHLGDWGTQFGMIIFGYKHWRNDAEYQADPIGHLTELYRSVRAIVDFQEARLKLPQLANARGDQERQIEQVTAAMKTCDAGQAKELKRRASELQKARQELDELIGQLQSQVARVEADADLAQRAAEHPRIAADVLTETAKLHAGDRENLQLWQEFLPVCRADIQRIYARLKIEFDYEHGESFYHDRLAPIVQSLRERGLATESDGAICLFLDGFETPMIIQKKDGAFLYSTSDLATIEYRMKEWRPQSILYVVDHRQHEHFEKLFAAARAWGYRDVDLRHVSFGTVLGDDGRPFKTRSGDTIGLEMLLDEAERRALEVLRQVSEEREVPFDEAQQAEVARVVGIGALKYADLSQNRQTDYKFSFDKMLELKGNTATYLQYLFARVQGIFRKSGISAASLRGRPQPFAISTEIERKLAIRLLRFGDILDDVLVDYRPNLLAQYLFDLAQTFFTFYNQCSVLQAESESLRASRLQLCDLTGRTVKLGLELLGIEVVDQM